MRRPPMQNLRQNSFLFLTAFQKPRFILRFIHRHKMFSGSTAAPATVDERPETRIAVTIYLFSHWEILSEICPSKKLSSFIISFLSCRYRPIFYHSLRPFVHLTQFQPQFFILRRLVQSSGEQKKHSAKTIKIVKSPCQSRKKVI